MSVSVRERLAAKLQGIKINNSVVDNGATLSDKQKFLLVKLVNSKVYDGDAVVNGTKFTYGELAESQDTRPDGTSGTHYPNIWALTKAQGEPAIQHLLNCPDKAKNGSGFSRNNSSGKNNGQTNGLTAEAIQNIVLDTMVALLDGDKEPATPVPVEDHIKVSTGKPVENLPTELNHLQVVRFGNDLFQIVTKNANGEPLATPRFRKTISDS